MRRAALGAACTCLALGACATEQEPVEYRFHVQVGLSPLPDASATIDGVVVTAENFRGFEKTFASYEVALGDAGFTIELIQAGDVVLQLGHRPGDVCASHPEVGIPTIESLDYSITNQEGEACILGPGRYCEGTEGSFALVY